MNYFKGKTIHFIGIGGIGMSAIAELLFDMGFKVQGSNIAENERLPPLTVNWRGLYR